MQYLYGWDREWLEVISMAKNARYRFRLMPGHLAEIVVRNGLLCVVSGTSVYLHDLAIHNCYLAADTLD